MRLFHLAGRLFLELSLARVEKRTEIMPGVPMLTLEELPKSHEAVTRGREGKVKMVESFGSSCVVKLRLCKLRLYGLLDGILKSAYVPLEGKFGSRWLNTVVKG